MLPSPGLSEPRPCSIPQEQFDQREGGGGERERERERERE